MSSWLRRIVFSSGFAVVGAIIAPTSFAAAAPALSAPRAVHLAEALAYAREHQPLLRAAQARVRARRAEANVATARWYPRVGALAELFAGTANNTTTVYSNRSVVDLPRIGNTTGTASFELTPYPSTIVAVGLQQEIFDFGRIPAETAAADADAAAEALAADATWLDLAFNVEEAYFAVSTARQVLKASEEAAARALVHRDYAQANVKSGLRPPIELTRAEADVARFETAVTRARGGLAIAQASLAAVLASDEPALDAADAVVDLGPTPPLDEALSRAATKSPAVLATLQQARAEELRGQAVRAQSRPDLSATLSFSGRAGGAPSSGSGKIPDSGGWAPVVPNWDVGLVFTWPLFDATVNARGQVADERAAERREAATLAKINVAAAVRRAYVELTVAQDALGGLERAQLAAKANYEQADARFRSGLGTSVELADAESLRAQADVQTALGRFAIARARANLGRVLAETR